MCLVHTDEDESTQKKSDLINWYLKDIESEIDSEEELVNRKQIIEKVIHRLVHYVSILTVFNINIITKLKAFCIEVLLDLCKR